jgi:hypothetical protein
MSGGNHTHLSSLGTLLHLAGGKGELVMQKRHPVTGHGGEEDEDDDVRQVGANAINIIEPHISGVAGSQWEGTVVFRGVGDTE